MADQIFKEISFDQEDEIDDSPLDEGKRKIFTDKTDPEVISLYNRWKDGSLILRPDFQRGFVWDNARASRLIESVLLNIPLPMIYLFEEKDGKQNVIDGQQRLTSLFSFIDGHFPDPDNRPFKLGKLKAFPEYNNKFFKELEKDVQQKIKTFSIRTILFQKDSNPDLQFEIFERLNIGAVSLNDMELRNCVYRGKFNDLIWELTEDADFRFLLNLDGPERRMRDGELVLRFSSFFIKSYINYTPPIKRFLNHTMQEYRDISDAQAKSLRQGFKNAVHIIRSMFGDHAFKRYYAGSLKDPNGYWEKNRFNVSLFDILMDTFARMDKNQVYRHLDKLREALIHLMISNQDFIDSIELSTSSNKAVTKRFDIWRKTIEEVIGNDTVQPRVFSIELKRKLFDLNPTCLICGNAIDSIDDSAIDHIEHYWKGGKTIPENARLTHRYCNWAREKK